MSVTIRKGTNADMERLLRLLHIVKDTMKNPEWFYLDPDEDVRQLMRHGVMQLWVAEDNGRLAGIFTILYPGLSSFNYGHDLNFTEEELLRVAQMDTAAVHPDYRGLGIQKLLMETAEQEIRQEKNRILLCTVHPDNRYSLQNVLKQNYTIERKLEKYDSVRYILRKDLT